MLPRWEGLLVQLLFDHFLAGSRTKRSPKTVRAFKPRCTSACAIPDDHSVIFVACFDGIRHEDHGTVAHQDVSTTLVSTTCTIDARSPCAIAVAIGADGTIRWKNGRDPGMNGVPARPPKSTLGLDAA